MSYGNLFVAAAGTNMSASPTTLNEKLAELLRTARAEQPSVPLSDGDVAAFVKHLGRSLPDDSDVLTWLNGLFIGDFLLCWAATQGNEAALKILVDDHVTPACRVTAGSTDRVEELVTDVASHLFVRSGKAPPRIAVFTGRGQLGPWLRMVAKRRAIELHRGERRRPAQEEYARRTMKVIDPELDFLKFRYARQFNEALEEVLSALPAEDANLLNLTSVEQVSSKAVAQMRNVSSRTIQRRLTSIRDEVYSQLRRRMRERLDASPDEVESLLGLVRSQLGVTLRRVLSRPDPPAAG